LVIEYPVLIHKKPQPLAVGKAQQPARLRDHKAAINRCYSPCGSTGVPVGDNDAGAKGGMRCRRITSTWRHAPRRCR
jgi:hypothetical protein